MYMYKQVKETSYTNKCTLNGLGSVLSRVPLVNKRDGGPHFNLSYSHNLNQMEFISGIAGPTMYIKNIWNINFLK